MAHQAATYLKQLVFLLPPGWDASIKFTSTHLYTWVERGTVRVKCLALEHNTVAPAKLEPGLLHLECTALTIRWLCNKRLLGSKATKPQRLLVNCLLFYILANCKTLICKVLFKNLIRFSFYKFV